MVEKLFPAVIALMAQVYVEEWIVSRSDGPLDEGEARLLRGSAAFSYVAVGTGTNDVVPSRFAAHTSGNHVVE